MGCIVLGKDHDSSNNVETDVESDEDDGYDNEEMEFEYEIESRGRRRRFVKKSDVEEKQMGLTIQQNDEQSEHLDEKEPSPTQSENGESPTKHIQQQLRHNDESEEEVHEKNRKATKAIEDSESDVDFGDVPEPQINDAKEIIDNQTTNTTTNTQPTNDNTKTHLDICDSTSSIVDAATNILGMKNEEMDERELPVALEPLSGASLRKFSEIDSMYDEVINSPPRKFREQKEDEEIEIGDKR